MKSVSFEKNDAYENAAFIVKGRLPRRGWNMIEIALEVPDSCAAVRFYFDFGNGFVDKDSLFLPLRAGRITKRLCYLPVSAKSVCLELIDLQGEFGVSHFRFTWLTPWFAFDRLCQRLANMHYIYRGQKKKIVKHNIRAQARAKGIHWRELAFARYDETFIKRHASSSYSSWIERVENPNIPTDKEVAHALRSLSFQPLISIVLPTYNSDEGFLRQCIDSVINQSYPKWQLCIADDCSTLSYIKPLLQEYADHDDRIHVVFRSSNGHIAEASNSALTLASGDYIALLDHDDLLANHALLKIVESLNATPNAGVIYSDEDKINDKGERFDPYFKSDWNPDLLLSQNYISHLGVYSAELIRSIGGFRAGVEGSQDHDLILRCTSRLEDVQIIHIPEILYHWRSVEGSTAERPEEKNYTTDAGIKALNYYFDYNSIKVEVEPGMLLNTYRIHWPIPDELPLVSLMIPTRDGYKILKKCVNSILEKTTYENYEILILNNKSRCPDTLQFLDAISRDKRVTVYDWDHTFNYSAINNFGATKAKGSILGLLNNDIEVINPDWLEEMVSHSCREKIGCVGAKLYYPNETVQHAGVVLGIGGVAGHAHKYFSRGEHGYFSRLRVVQNFSAVTGACLLVRKGIYDQVGGLDENLVVAFNDVDFCLKVREAGFRNLWTPYAELYHHESLTRGADNTNKKRLRARREAEYMRERWGGKLDSDPAYNPNLTLIYEDFSLRQ